MSDTPELRIECATSRKLLARVSVEGIKVWCARHRCEELRTWEELEAMRRQLAAYTNATSSEAAPAVMQSI